MSEATAEPPAPDAIQLSKTAAAESNSPSFCDTLKSGDLVASLEFVRDEIAADLQECQSMRDKAALYTRMVDVLTRIDEAKPVESKGDAVDEIAARRAARRSGTSTYSSRTKHSS